MRTVNGRDEMRRLLLLLLVIQFWIGVDKREIEKTKVRWEGKAEGQWKKRRLK